MNKRRKAASCTVFEGKIVVSGGFSLNTVESYDFYANKWTYLPSMIEYRSFHASVSMGNKLFVIGGWSESSCEVFDSFTRKFTYIQSINQVDKFYDFRPECVSTCNGFVVFDVSENRGVNNEIEIYLYDIESNKFVAVVTSHCESVSGARCVKYYAQ